MPPKRSAFAIVYMCIAFATLMMLASLAVDLGRVQLAKTELQRAADAASRYGAMGLSDGTWLAKAQQAASDNMADGSSVTLSAVDVVRGNWASSTFVANTTPYNSVQVTVRRTGATGNAIPLLFAQILGSSFCDVKASSTAYIVASSSATSVVPGTSDPWLAGMPNGTYGGYSGDSAPTTSPKQITGVPISSNAVVSFSVTGSVSNTGSASGATPDGQSGCCTNQSGALYGMGNCNAPLCSMIAVFLDNTQPDSTAAPADLDFSSSASRDYTTLTPLLKQVFFVGDGLTSTGIIQKIVAPAGATRLYIGMLDAYEWNNNYGSFSTSVTVANNVSTVK